MGNDTDAGRSRRDRTAWLFRPVAVDSLAVFRVALGAAVLWEVARYAANGWIAGVFIAPGFHFTYLGFGWVRPLPGAGMYAVFFALGLAAAGVMLGLWYRASVVAMWLLWTYVFLCEKAVYLNHFYLVALLSFLMIWVPAHGTLSFDARRLPGVRRESMPAWCLWLIRGQLALPYFFGGLAKFDADWLRGQPMGIWMGRMDALRELVPAFGEQWLAVAFSYAGLVFDLLVVPGLLWRRTRPVVFAAAVAFHLLNAAMFQIGIFPWLMIAATTLFFEPDWPRRFLPKRKTTAARRPAAEVPHEAPPGVPRGAIVAALAVWFTVQCLVPLRHLLYPGRVNWTEEGLRFSWRMMLLDKSAAFQVVAVDPRTGRRYPIKPQGLLNERQVDRLGQESELLHEFSRYVAETFREEGLGEVEVRAFVLCSLNGRKPELLVDPHANLAATPRSLRPIPWILPLTRPLPDEPWLVPQDQWAKYLDFAEIERQAAERGGD